MLSDQSVPQPLVAFLCANAYTTILTSLALTELFNPGWRRVQLPDRVDRAVSLLSQVPCVIVEPREVFEAELEAGLQPVKSIPVRIDLEEMTPGDHAEVLRRLLRRDSLFVEQGHDIQVWADHVAAAKKRWLAEVGSIIENACASGYLLRDRRGGLTLQPESRELFLYSLDLRHAPPNRVDAILHSHLNGRTRGAIPMLTAVRLSSLCFLHAYVGIDPSNRIKAKGSDIADIYHLSLAPYCAAFTTDKSMLRMLQSVEDSGVPLSCRVMTRSMLEDALHQPG